MPRKMADQSKRKRDDGKVLIQVRIPEGWHERLTLLCEEFGQNIAQRLKMIVREDLEQNCPLALIDVQGKTQPTAVIVEQTAVGCETVDVSVRVMPDDARGIFPEALGPETVVSMPNRWPYAFSIKAGYQDTDGAWHLHLRQRP